MKIGIDFHGVIDKYTEEFINLFNAIKLLDLPIEIWIVSGPPEKEVEMKLNRLGIFRGREYEGILSVVDYLKDNHVKMWLDDRNTWWASDFDWWSSKANLCRDNYIDLMIDDNEKYEKYFDLFDLDFYLLK